MCGDEYVPGALVLAKSWRACYESCETPVRVVDLICMVTPDVSHVARKLLSTVFTRVIEVAYIRHPVMYDATEKQQKMYGRWMSCAFTKWNCLTLVEYDKICFIDADMVFLQNASVLFETTPTPAATWSSPWSAPYAAVEAKRAPPPANPYGRPRHGQVVSSETIAAILYAPRKRGPVSSGALVLLSPQPGDMELFQEMVHEHKAYGHHCSSGIDEQAIVDFYHRIKKSAWHHIHQSFQMIPWRVEWLLNETHDYKGDFLAGPGAAGNAKDATWIVSNSFMFHYFGVKPWSAACQSWPDLVHWTRYRDPTPSCEIHLPKRAS